MAPGHEREMVSSPGITVTCGGLRWTCLCALLLPYVSEVVQPIARQIMEGIQQLHDFGIVSPLKLGLKSLRARVS